MKLRTLAISLALAGAMVGAAQAAPVAAWEIASPIGFTNNSWSFGEIFTVGASSITVSALGAFDNGHNGFISTGGIKVGLFNESSGALLTSASVLSSDNLIGNYRFTDITDIVLLANTQYRLVGVSDNDLYNISTPSPNSVDTRVTWNRYGYCNTTLLTKCDDFTGSERTWVANMLIGPNDGGNSVPEPGSLALLGLGIAGLATIRRKRPA